MNIAYNLTGLMQMLRDIGEKKWTAIAVIAGAAMVSHAVSVTAGLLLDEQFLYRWSLTPINSPDWRAFLAFSGPGSAEIWAVLTPLISTLLNFCSLNSAALVRLQGIVLHTVVTCLLFRLLLTTAGHKLGNAKALPIALSSAVLFAAVPFSSGAVTWLGGRGTLIATGLLFGSLLCYACGRGLDSDNYRSDIFDPGWLATSLLLLVAALLASPGIFLFFWPWFVLEAVVANRAKEGARRSELTYFVIGPLIVLVVVAAFAAASGLWWQLQDLNANPGFAYPFMHAWNRFDTSVLYPYCAVVAAAIALFIRWLTNHLPRSFRGRVHFALVVVLVLASAAFNWNRYLALRASSELVGNIQSALYAHRQKSGGNVSNSYIFVADLPDTLSVSPRWSATNLACFDAATALLSAHPIPADRLLRDLAQGQLTGQTLMFDAASKKLSAYIRSPEQAELLKQKWERAAAEQANSVPVVLFSVSDKASRRDYCAPFYKFPSLPQLGLFSVSAIDARDVSSVSGSPVVIDGQFDVSRIKNAAGIAVEISFPNQAFTAAKSNRLSGNEYRLLPFMGTTGKSQLTRANFAGLGLYSVRVVAIDSGHTPVGNFSSPMYCLVCR